MSGLIEKIFTEHLYGIGVWTQSSDAFRINVLDCKQWWADPVPYREGDQDYVFCEVMDRSREIGWIGVSEMDRDGRMSRPEPVIREPFHMSFPELLTDGRDLYMIPETSAAGEIRVYKKGATIRDWSLYATFPGYRVVDLSVAKTETAASGHTVCTLLGSSETEPHSLLTKLRLFELDLQEKTLAELTEETAETEPTYWNRNGGSVIRSENALIRVAQEAEEGFYGRNICLFQIDRIGRGQHYQETLQKKITINDLSAQYPSGNWRGIGIHTWQEKQDLCVIDVHLTHTGWTVPFTRAGRVIRKHFRRNR
ncbi:MAG: hypothetical protein K6B72_01305 [Lachnospiraceae bacterium]|nr:hypothetical protein [Lachnospiraceae bacterium]